MSHTITVEGPLNVQPGTYSGTITADISVLVDGKMVTEKNAVLASTLIEVPRTPRKKVDFGRLSNWKNYWLLTRSCALLSCYQKKNPAKLKNDEWGIADNNNLILAKKAEKNSHCIPRSDDPLKSEEERFKYTVGFLRKTFDNRDIIDAENGYKNLYDILDAMEENFKEYQEVLNKYNESTKMFKTDVEE